MTGNGKRYLLCIRNDGCEDLELRKLYESPEAPPNTEPGYVSVIDESGEDYLYPADLFVEIDLPPAARRAFRS